MIDRVPQNHPAGSDDGLEPVVTGRFAPYPVWLTLRWICMAGAALVIGWFASVLVALASAINGGTAEPWPVWIGIVGMVLGASPRFDRGNLPPFGEMVGRMLASKHCPSCGQSIFDHSRSSGYEEDIVKRRWWPSRWCTNCGHDLMNRTVA